MPANDPETVIVERHISRESWCILVADSQFLFPCLVFLLFDCLFLYFLLRLLSRRDKSSFKAYFGEVLRADQISGRIHARCCLLRFWRTTIIWPRHGFRHYSRAHHEPAL